jgi:hypothetical protein
VTFFYGEKLSEFAEILWGFTKFQNKQMLKISTFNLDKQKKILQNKI